jgi:hypothetical protein
MSSREDRDIDNKQSHLLLRSLNNIAHICFTVS